MELAEVAGNFKRAFNHYKNGEYDNSLKLLEDITTSFPDLAEPQYLRSVLEYKKQLPDRAMKSITTAIKLDPTNLKYQYTKGSFEYNYDKYPEAIETINQIIAIDPCDREALKIKMLSQYCIDDYMGALDTINQIGVHTRYFQEDDHLKDYREKVIDALGNRIQITGSKNSMNAPERNATDVADPLALLKTRLVLGEINEAEFLRLKGLIS